MKSRTRKEAFQRRNQNYINKSATFEMGMSSQEEEEDDYVLYFSLFEMLSKRNSLLCIFVIYYSLLYHDMYIIRGHRLCVGDKESS